MAINNVSRTIILDVYKHDNPVQTINAIAADNDSRYVIGEIQNDGERFDIGANSTVELIVVRSDDVGVITTGQPTPFSYQPDEGAAVTYYGVYAELDQAALAVKGLLFGQFRITSGSQVLRTEIFQIDNGRALDAETDEWASEYQGYSMADIVRRIEALEAGGGGGEGGSSTLAGLTDTNIGSRADGQVLTYSSAAGKWVNRIPAAATISNNGYMTAEDKQKLEVVYADYSAAITALGE